MDALGTLFNLVFSLNFVVLLTLGWLGWTCVYVVRGKEAAILETLGKPKLVASMPGLHFKLPFPITCVVGHVKLQLDEAAMEVDVKTSDNAMLKVPVKVQYKASDDTVGAVKAHYELKNPEPQIKSYVLNVVRQTVSSMTMDEVYQNRDKVEQAVKDQVQTRFTTFGYIIENVLVDQPQPDEKVRDAFNRVISSKRELEAAANEADAEKRRRVGKAEAERDSKRLQGEGIRQMREQVAQGAADATKKLKEAMPSLNDAQLAEFLLSITRLDSLTQVGEHGNLVLMDLNGNGSQLPHMLAAVRAGKHGANGVQGASDDNIVSLTQ